jgi:hypothetical protein
MNALIATQDPHLAVVGRSKSATAIARVARTLTSRVTVAADLVALPPVDLVIIDFDSLPEPQQRQLLTVSPSSSCPELVLVGKPPRALVGEVLATRRPINVLARGGDFDLEMLIVTVQKILRKDVFGIEKYLTWGVEPRTCTISTSDERDAFLADVQVRLAALALGPRLVGACHSLLDELTAYSLFDASADAGAPPSSRSARVALQQHEKIEIKWCFDGARVGVSVSDPFGTLSREAMVRGVSNCLSETPEAETKELGLYYAFASSSHFIVNIAPGRRTELIGFLSVRGGYREFAEQGTSFNFFVEE